MGEQGFVERSSQALDCGYFNGLGTDAGDGDAHAEAVVPGSAHVAKDGCTVWLRYEFLSA